MDDCEPKKIKDFNDYIRWFLWVCIGLLAFGMIWRAVVPPEPRERLKYSVGREILRDNRLFDDILAENRDGLESTTERIMEVTAYCPCEKCCGKYADGITASGYVIQPGDKFTAAPADIPFGTMIDIPGYGRVPVLDRGGKIGSGRLDVYFDSHDVALKFGRQILTVKIER